MKKLRILFNTSRGAFRHPGGGEVQLLETKRGLEKLGHSVKILEGENYRADFTEFDVFHNFNIHRDNWPFIRDAKKAGLPVAISTIYWPSLRYAMAGHLPPSKKIKMVAAELANRLGGPKFGTVKKMLAAADILLPNSIAEGKQLKRVFGVEEEKLLVVHNGVEGRFAGASPKLFEKTHGLKDFVLFVGRIEERKNVLGLIEAFNAIKGSENLVIIGSAAEKDKAYFEKCVKKASGSTVFLPAMPHDSKMLESAYAACKVFCLPSWYETPGLAALEAALAGANIVITREGCTREYFGEHALYVNPAGKKDIAEKVAVSLEKKRGKALQKRIAKKFLWENTAIETIRGYERILGD
jgi:glycosyltransferase involved in cell wall biosynthesis